MIEFKTYAGQEFLKVAQYLEKLGEPQPNPLLCVGFTVEEDSDIKGLSVVQSLPVIEPFTAEKGYGQFLGRLFEMTEEFVKGADARRVLMHTSDLAMMRMLKRIRPAPKLMADQFFDWRKAA